MSILGIIAEYNPFHNGHFYHLEEAKRLTGRKHVLAVMSGNFVQRGEPALCDKWRRTRMALLGGVDVVVELPVYYAAAGADYFAGAAVRLLDASGIADSLCFGSESGEMALMEEAGRLLAEEPPAFKDALKRGLDAGLSFPSARSRALASEAGIPEDFMRQPNHILGVEYCKTLRALSSKIRPYTLRRAADGDACAEKSYASARFIRNTVLRGGMARVRNLMPGYSYEILNDAASRNALAALDRYSGIFQYLLRTSPPETLRRAADMTEGLENRFRHLCGQPMCLSELLSAVKTKRYTLTRLQRAALHVILGITAEALGGQAGSGPPYIRVLGFRKESAFLLGELRRRASLPVVLNIKHAPRILPAPALAMLRKEAETTDVYTLAGGVEAIGYEYTMPLVII